MCLLAAATTFTACSSSDDLNGNTSESKDGSMYMTLTVQTPSSTGTRTDGKETQTGTEAETSVTTGTLYLVDPNGKTVFSKNIAEGDWEENKKPGTSADGTLQTIKLEVNLVSTKTPYKVYFLANKTSDKTPSDKTPSDKTPWMDDTFTSTTTGDDVATKFSFGYSDNNAFVMFNQNDAKRKANGYTVEFKDENKSEKVPAKVMYGSSESNIYLDRIVARIDQPTSKATEIADGSGLADASETYKEQLKDAREKVKSIVLQRYAVSNLPNSTYAMQHWTDETCTTLSIPTVSYQQDYDSFGTLTEAKGISGTDDQFMTWTSDGQSKNYVFENYPKELEASASQKDIDDRNHNLTAMYFEYKITLNESKFTSTSFDIKGEGDAWDGTFYRYNGVIYTSLQAIYKQYKDVAGWNKLAKLTKNAETGKYTASTTDTYNETEVSEAVAALKDCLNDEENLSTLRAAWGIEVFRQGLCYYKQTIHDSNYNKDAVLRNSIYKLNVATIYNIGADVPNGKPTEQAMYYMSVGVTVNPWVLSEQNVIFK